MTPARPLSSMSTPSSLLVQQTLFSAHMPVFTCNLAPHGEALRHARHAIDELRASDPKSIESNVKSQYVSPWDSHNRNARLTPLCELVLAVARTASQSYLNPNSEHSGIDYFVKDCWGIIYEEADYTIKHNHFPSDLSCAIYLEADDACAPIIFEGSVQVQPVPNLLVMFPGILNHEVPKTPGRRVVVAMNMFKTEGLVR